MTVKILRSPNYQQLPADPKTKEIIAAIREKYLEYLNDPIDHSELMALVEKIREAEEKFGPDSDSIVKSRNKPKGIF